jgi:hypothetical protein
MQFAGKTLVVASTLSLLSGCGGGGGGSSGPSASFALSAAATPEDAGVSSLNVVLHTSLPLEEDLSVDVVDLGTGTATSGSDYTPIPTQTLTFPIGSVDGAVLTVDFGPLDDALVETANETVKLRLQNAVGGGVSGPSNFTGTIQDIHAAAVGFANAGATSADESGTESIALELDCGVGVTLGIPVSVRVSDLRTGSATSGNDYTAFSAQTVTFAPGSADGAVMTVDLAITSDTNLEGNETVNLGLAVLSGCSLGTHTVFTLTIADDELAGAAAFVGTEGADGTGNALTYDESLALGTVAVGAGPNAGTLVRVMNGGGTSMELGAPEIGGTHANDFVVEIESTNTPLGTFTSGLAIDARQAPLALVSDAGPGLLFALDAAGLAHSAELDHVSWHGFALPGLGTVTLELERERLPIAEDAVLAIDGVPVPGGVRTLAGDLALWSGSVAGVEGSRVFLALDADGAHGHIDLGAAAGGLVQVFSDAPGRVRLVTEAQLATLGFTPPAELCAGERFAPGQVPIQGLPEEPDSSALTMADCRLALETDFQLYQAFGSSNALTDYVTGLIGAVSAQYSTDVQTTLSIAYLGIHTTSNDGWSAQDSGGDALDVLNEFQTDWGSNWPATADLAHFLSGASLGGGVAYVDVLCSPSFGFGVSGNIDGNIDWGAWTGAAGNFTWDFMVVAHELGHNFGSQHTHSYCPPLDHCYTNCDSTTSCTRGTIMSYCHVCGGMSNIDLFFHPVTADIMRANVNTSCLDVGVLLPGDFINYRVRFNPLTATGARSANIVFDHDALNVTAPFRIQLTGTSN